MSNGFRSFRQRHREPSVETLAFNQRQQAVMMRFTAHGIAFPMPGFLSCQNRFRSFANARALLGQAPAALPARGLGSVVAKMRTQTVRPAPLCQPIVDALGADLEWSCGQLKPSLNLLWRPILAETAGRQLPERLGLGRVVGRTDCATFQRVSMRFLGTITRPCRDTLAFPIER